MDSGTFRVYDEYGQLLHLPPGLQGIPAYLSVSNKTATILTGTPEILSHFGINAGAPSGTVAVSSSPIPSSSVPSSSVPSSSVPSSSVPPAAPTYNPTVPGLNYNQNVPPRQPPPSIHITSETEKKAALNAAKLEEYNRKSQMSSYSY
jgi:hypothetical protein